MASLEDYDEFGNYIGVDLDSDDEEEDVQQFNFTGPPQSHPPLEGYDDEPIPGGPDEGALMEIDGLLLCNFFKFNCMPTNVVQNLSIMR